MSRPLLVVNGRLWSGTRLAADAVLDAGMRASAIHYERFDFGAGRGRLDHRRRRQALSVFAVLAISMVGSLWVTRPGAKRGDDPGPAP